MAKEKIIEEKVKDLLIYNSQFEDFTGIEDMACYEAICIRSVLVDVVESGLYSIDALVDLKEEWGDKENPITLKDGSAGQWSAMRNNKVEFLGCLIDWIMKK